MSAIAEETFCHWSFPFLFLIFSSRPSTPQSTAWVHISSYKLYSFLLKLHLPITPPLCFFIRLLLCYPSIFFLVMLRAASRGIRPRIVRQSSGARLTSKRTPLPRLCPSRYLYHQPIRWSSSNTRSVSLPSETPADRSYSTAAAALEFSDIDTSAVFPPLSQNAAPYSIPVEPLEPLDASQLLLFENWAGSEERYTDDSAGAILSNKNEVFATFHACLATGSMFRAQLMLEQITKKCKEEGDTAVLVDAHNAFLKGLLNQQSDVGVLHSLKLFFMWFENKMRSEYSIKGDATTFALLLKASFDIPNESARKRYLMEYVTLWKYDNPDILDVLENPLLSDPDVLEIAKVRSKRGFRLCRD